MAEPKPFYEQIYPILERLEKVVLAILIVLFAIRYAGVMTSVQVLRIGLIGLAIVYFFMGFRPPPQSWEGQKLNFIELLVAVTIPKILWISSSVGAVGLAFHFGGDPGASQMLFIQCASALFGLVAGLIGLGISKLQKIESTDRITTPMMRAVPMGLAAAYILLQ